MKSSFRNREEAGELLAQELTAYAQRADVLVLALPRGGVPVAAQIAQRLGVPLDLFLVRKLGVPGYPELAMGAIAHGGVRSLNMDVINSIRIPDYLFEQVVAEERQELERRAKAYRDGLPLPEVAGKTVILVDDGIATGSTVIAAIGALRKMQVGKIIVAVPVIADATLPAIERVADRVVVLLVPELFYGVGGFYEDFSQTTDEEVRRLLAETQRPASCAVA